MSTNPRQRLLITGIPGAGKTSIGRHLQAEHGLAHVDLEDDATRARFLEDRAAFVAGLPGPVVVTWGFHPVYNAGDVRLLKQHGLFLVWLDGDRPAALRAFLARGTVAEYEFYQQMLNIELTGVIRDVRPEAFVNPFGPTGVFRPVQDIAAELLAF